MRARGPANTAFACLGNKNTTTTALLLVGAAHLELGDGGLEEADLGQRAPRHGGRAHLQMVAVRAGWVGGGQHVAMRLGASGRVERIKQGGGGGGEK